jgi:hypothetical protein
MLRLTVILYSVSCYVISVRFMLWNCLTLIFELYSTISWTHTLSFFFLFECKFLVVLLSFEMPVKFSTVHKCKCQVHFPSICTISLIYQVSQIVEIICFSHLFNLSHMWMIFIHQFVQSPCMYFLKLLKASTLIWIARTGRKVTSYSHCRWIMSSPTCGLCGWLGRCYL